MFNCYTHGWSNYERMCPACCMITTCSSHIVIPPDCEFIPKKEHEKIVSKLADAEKELEYLYVILNNENMQGHLMYYKSWYMALELKEKRRIWDETKL